MTIDTDTTKRDYCSVRKIISHVISRSHLRPEQIASEMSALLGCAVVVEKRYPGYALNTKNNSPAVRFPLAWTRAFCLATGDWQLLQLICAGSPFRLVDTKEITKDEQYIKIGKQAVRIENARRRYEAALSGKPSAIKRTRSGGTR